MSLQRLTFSMLRQVFLAQSDLVKQNLAASNKALAIYVTAYVGKHYCNLTTTLLQYGKLLHFIHIYRPEYVQIFFWPISYFY